VGGGGGSWFGSSMELATYS